VKNSLAWWERFWFFYLRRKSVKKWDTWSWQMVHMTLFGERVCEESKGYSLKSAKGYGLLPAR
jgi:hypothetical protein